MVYHACMHDRSYIIVESMKIICMHSCDTMCICSMHNIHAHGLQEKFQWYSSCFVIFLWGSLPLMHPLPVALERRWELCVLRMYFQPRLDQEARMLMDCNTHLLTWTLLLWPPSIVHWNLIAVFTGNSQNRKLHYSGTKLLVWIIMVMIALEVAVG
jgi:hypothetical protein